MRIACHYSIGILEVATQFPQEDRPVEILFLLRICLDFARHLETKVLYQVVVQFD
jgi:hypothetical protein